MGDGRISDAGRKAEREFFGLVPDARRTDRSSLGDAVVDGVPVEIKQASSTTLNQVRAVKYIPLVCLDTTCDCWYVVPAHEVVRLVSGKKRGQHTENPFESATLSTSNLRDFIVDDPTELAACVRRAIAEAANYPKLKSEMERIQTASSVLAEESIARVKDLLD